MNNILYLLVDNLTVLNNVTETNIISAISIKQIFIAFIAMFGVIDIIGSIPIIISIKENKRSYNALNVSIISLGVLLCFLFLGQGLLGLFGLDVSSFAVAGGLVLMVLSVEMLFGIEIFKDDGPSSSVTIVPLVFPLIAGPAVLTTLLSLSAEYHVLNIVIAAILNMIVVYIVLKKVFYVERLIGKQGIYILRKFFGIILMAMSIKLITSNLISIVGIK